MGNPGWSLRAVAVAISFVVCGLATAQSRPDLPDGLVVGPWVFEPYIESSYEYNSNLFREDDDNTPITEQVIEYGGGLTVTVPIRNSSLELSHDQDRVSYSDTEIDTPTRQTRARFRLIFGTGDRLVLRARKTRSLAEVETIDAGGEFTFTGEAFRHSTLGFELERSLPNRQGYAIKVTRYDLNFENRNTEGFFDYRGFQTSFEYRQPFVNRKWLTLRYSARRFNHYRSSALVDGVFAVIPVGTPFRKELTDSMQLGIRGLVTKGQPYFVRLGFSEVSYEFAGTAGSQSEFRELVAAAGWGLNFGRSSANFTVTRTSLPSNFDTFYVTNEIRADLSRDWMRNGEYGFEILLGKNRYSEILLDSDGMVTTQCGNKIRDDFRVGLDAYASWEIDSLIEFEVSAGRERRSSNCENLDFETNEFTASLSFGW